MMAVIIKVDSRFIEYTIYNNEWKRVDHVEAIIPTNVPTRVKKGYQSKKANGM